MTDSDPTADCPIIFLHYYMLLAGFHLGIVFLFSLNQHFKIFLCLRWGSYEASIDMSSLKILSMVSFVRQK